VASKGEAAMIKEGDKSAIQLTLIPSEGPPSQSPR
jgi:hypothetical protein